MQRLATDALCTHCALCCDGTLFGDVELRGGAEADGLEILGLPVDDDGDGRVLLQPCTALVGRRCAVYAHRPRSCRSFECALLTRVRTGALGVTRALVRIREARSRVRRVERLVGSPQGGTAGLSLRERCMEAFATPARTSHDASRQRRLRAALADLERTIRSTFLTAPVPPGAPTGNRGRMRPMER